MTMMDGAMSGAGGGRGRGRPPVVQVDLGKMFDRLPPHSPEAEAALLGAMIIDPKVTGEIIGIVKTPDAFYSQANGVIFSALLQLYDRHQAGDIIQLNEILRDKGVLQDVGGPEYIINLTAGTPSSAAAPYYAKIIADKYKLRRLIQAAGHIAFEAYNAGSGLGGPEEAREVVDAAESKIFEIAQEEQSADPQSLKDLVQIEYDRLEALHGKGLSGIRTYFDDLDELTSGLQGGEMIIIAARPSMGKTAFSLNLAQQIAMGGTPEAANGEKVPVGFFSLEMSKSSIAQRLLSAQARISGHKMRSGRLTPDDYEALIAACGKLAEAPIYIDDTPGLSVLMLRTRARRMVAQYGVRCIIVDYLQLMSAPQAARESRQVEVSAISRGLKALARELNIPVVCLSQLNRGPESREANRPRMSDLRESGSIEQDADVVMLLHREEYYHIGDPNWADENPDKVGVAELIIAKQRNGPTDTVHLKWDNETTRFKNYAGARSGPSGYASDGGYAARPSPVARPPQQGGGYGGGGYADAGPAEPGSFKVEVRPFAPGRKTGPIENHRDGGGPERPVFDEPDDYGDAPF